MRAPLFAHQQGCTSWIKVIRTQHLSREMSESMYADKVNYYMMMTAKDLLSASTHYRSSAILRYPSRRRGCTSAHTRGSTMRHSETPNTDWHKRSSF